MMPAEFPTPPDALNGRPESSTTLSCWKFPIRTYWFIAERSDRDNSVRVVKPATHARIAITGL